MRGRASPWSKTPSACRAIWTPCEAMASKPPAGSASPSRVSTRTSISSRPSTTRPTTTYTAFTPAGGTDAARGAMTFFETVSGQDIVVEFRPTIAGSVVGINGLQFVPEPGMALPLGLGLVGIRRRRELRRGV